MIFKVIQVVLCIALASYLCKTVLGIFTNEALHSLLDRKALPTIIIGALPGYLYLSSYLILVFFWSTRYSDSETDDTTCRAKALYFGLIAVIIAVWFVFGTLFMVYNEDESIARQIHTIEIIFAASVQILGSFSFLVIGTRLWCKLHNTGLNIRQKKMHQMIAVMTSFCTVTFTMRAIFLIVRLYMEPTGVDNVVIEVVYRFFYYIVSPALMMILLGVSVPRTVGAHEFLRDEERRSHPSVMYSPLDYD
eukprot:TRINITY_DN487_c0_g1_i1.p1 TRINITY_DN487_c0_g1~~TRINITY_DN487_c0_g1_i1.p1  ORF type:complete len:249 (+),score=27.17 TRINITY_DN487_c0_g1_i1:340-1086(+)